MNNILDALEEEEMTVLDSIEQEESSIDNLKSQLSEVLTKFDDKNRKKEHDQLKKEFEETLKKEIAKIKPIQQVIERTKETQVRVPVHLQPKIIETPAPPPQIIREVRVEVEKKDNTKYVEESKYLDLLVKLSKIEKQLKETQRMAEFPIVVGGPGVIGIPPPEPNPVGYVLTVNSDKKAQWKEATGGSGGLPAGTFTVTNNTPEYVFDPTISTIDTLYQVVATLLRKLQGEI